MLFKGEVIMLDGTRVPFTAHQWELGQWESYALRKGLPPLEAGINLQMYVAYAAVHRAEWDSVTVGYEQWSRGIQGVEIDETEADVPPTQPAPSAD